MNESSRDRQWPPTALAVLINGDGNPSYYRPIEPDESIENFIARIANTVVSSIDSYPYPAFLEVIEGETGLRDDAKTLLVVQSMRNHRLLRRS